MTTNKSVIVWNEDCSAHLTLEKTVVNDHGGTAVDTDWTLSASSGPTPISGVEGNAAVTNATVLAGTYDLSESLGPTAYTASDWVCVANGGGGGPLPNFVQDDGDTVTLNPGDDVTCTITNDDQPAHIILVKHVVNDNGGTATQANFTPSIDGNPAVWGDNPVSAGAHTASESSLASYTASGWSNGCASGGTVSLALGETKTCEIMNDDIAPSLTLQKTVVNDSGGTADANDWTVTATGPTGFSGSGPIVANGPSFDAGTYDLSEVGPAGYTASDWVCVNGNQTDGDTVEIGLGQNVLCTITNNDDPPPIPTLTVVKIVVNDNGGTKVIANFPLFIDGFSVTSGVASTTSPGLHTVSETSQTGYLGTIGGDCAPDGTVTLASGEHKTCTITNDDLPPPATNSCDTPLVAPAGYILVNGSVGNDNVALSPFTMFVGNGGNDKVRALASGNYIICLGSGKDTVTLNGSGAVTIDAGDGDNTVTAMGTVVGYVKTGGGKDKLTFGSGERTILAGEGDNTVTALGSGNQTITTGTGNDKITTGSGNDVIVAGDGKNTVVAGAGSDSLTGGSGKDIFNGGPGTDTCNAGGGANTVVGCEL